MQILLSLLDFSSQLIIEAQLKDEWTTLCSLFVLRII